MTAITETRMGELASIVGDEHVTEGAESLSTMAIDGVAPTVCVQPGSVDEVAAVMRFANEKGLVVVPAGGFIHQGIGKTPSKIDILLTLNRLKNVEHYDPGDLTIGIGAGATIAYMQSLVGDHGQMFPADIGETDRVTLGGAMAVAAAGPMKHSFGGLREFCLGVHFVTADGKAAKAGGRVVKNVAGFDLMKLMIGSYGTLGVITSASFKLFPRPALTRTFVCPFESASAALAFRDWVVDSPLTPMCLELYSPGALRLSAWTIALRAAGSERVLARYAAEIGDRAASRLDGDEEQKFWKVAVDLEHSPLVMMRVGVPPQAIERILESLELQRREAGQRYAAWGRVGIGSLIIGLDAGTEDSYAKAIAAVRAALPRDGSAMVARCPLAMKSNLDVWGRATSTRSAMAAVKQAMDPKDILNRGRFLL